MWVQVFEMQVECFCECVDDFELCVEEKCEVVEVDVEIVVEVE